MMTKQLAIAFCAGALCCGGLLVATGFAPEDKAKDAMHKGLEQVKKQGQEAIDKVAGDQPEMSPEAMAEMQEWMKAGEPGEHHKELAKSVGEWGLTGWFVMNPGESPTEFAGKMVTTPVFEGRYFKSDMTFDMMGMPMGGLAFAGYDNIQGKYVSTWIDSMSTGIYYAEGYMSSDGKLIQKGTKFMPDGTQVVSKMVTVRHGADKVVDEFYDEIDGDWSLHGKITYTRTSASAHAGN